MYWNHHATGRCVSIDDYDEGGVYSIQPDKFDKDTFRAYWIGEYLPGKHTFTTEEAAKAACNRHNVLCLGQ